MFKVIKIGGKPIPMKANGQTAFLYQRHTGRDFLLDFFKLANFEEGSNPTVVLEDFAYVLAKTANPDIPEKIEWLGQFDGMFDLMNAYKDIVNLIGVDIKTNKKLKKNPNKKRKVTK